MKINKDSLPVTIATATANIGISFTAGRAIGTLLQPLLPAEIDLATKIGLNIITYAATLATSRAIINEVGRNIDAYNEAVVQHNEQNNQTDY